MKVNELLEFREELVNRHGEELAAVDQVVALMSVGMASAQLPLQIAVAMDQAEGLKGRKGREGPRRRGRPPGPDGSVIATVLKGVTLAPQTSREVADRCVPAVAGDGVSKSLSKLHEQGKVERSKELPYRYWLKGAKGAGAKSPPSATSVAAKAPPGEGAGPRRPREGMAGVTQHPGFGQGKLSDAIRAVCRKLPAGFSRLQVSEGLPERFQNQEGKSATAVTLLDMVARGELTRTGQGSEARYTVARLKGEKSGAIGTSRPTPSEKERRYQELRGEIQVPRDPEVEMEAS